CPSRSARSSTVTWRSEALSPRASGSDSLVRVPDGFLRRLLLRRRDQFRVVEQLFQEGRRIAVRGLFHVAPLVPRDFDEETPGHDGTRLGLRDVLRARVLVAMLDQEPGIPPSLVATTPGTHEHPGSFQ